MFFWAHIKGQKLRCNTGYTKADEYIVFIFVELKA